MITLSGLAAELYAEIGKMPVVDCHEHLPTEAERVAEKVDVTTLFAHYCKADLEAAGLLTGGPQEEVLDTSKPLAPRWETLKPYLQAIRFGSYAYPAFAYVREVLGFEDIDDSTFEAISERLQGDNRPGLYKRIIQDLCGIETAIQCKDEVEEAQTVVGEIAASIASKRRQPKDFAILCRNLLTLRIIGFQSGTVGLIG